VAGSRTSVYSGNQFLQATEKRAGCRNEEESHAGYPVIGDRKTMRGSRMKKRSCNDFTKIFLNGKNENDFIFVDPANPRVKSKFEKFITMWSAAEEQLRINREHLKQISDEVIAGVPDATKRLVALAEQNKKICQSAQDMIDGIFGPKTLRKYFRKLYEENPTFIPDEECINDFIINMKKALDIVYSENRPRGKQVAEVN
jgi:hypothetical protein